MLSRRHDTEVEARRLAFRSGERHHDGMRKDDDDSKYDHPWTEDEWLAEFRRNDVRSAKFGELLETFADDLQFSN
jgi:hypothetical protein